MRRHPLRLLLLGTGLFINSHIASGQTDTIRIMQYNLLNYGNSANPASYKNPRLSTLIQYVQPDIFGANEIANNSAHSQNILTNVLGTNWEKGNYINTNNEVQTNMLFWNSTKFGLKSQQSICYNLRDIIAYKLYYKDTITVPHDTVFVTIMVAHLKASQGTQEEAERAQETQAVVNYLNSLGTQGNYILMGDLNVYTSSEQAYQNVVNSINPISRLNDPINQPGDWNGDPLFAGIHTQSTRTSQLPDGGVNGGLDDRFDFQLVSNYIMNDAAGMKYLPTTYKTLGQDGQHLNKAVNAPPNNTSAPANIIQALYEMSDHLPVYADYVVHATSPNSTATINNITFTTTVVNPIVDNQLTIFLDERLKGETVNIQLYTIHGKVEFTASTTVTATHYTYPLENLSAGLHFLRITSKNGYSYVAKIMN